MILLQIDDDADAAGPHEWEKRKEEETETETVIGCTRKFDLIHTHEANEWSQKRSIKRLIKSQTQRSIHAHTLQPFRTNTS